MIAIAMVCVLLLTFMAGCKYDASVGADSEATTEPIGTTEPTVAEYAAGTLVFSPDGVARFYGERNTVTETFTGWETELYVYPDDTGWYIYEIPWTPVARKVLHIVIEEGVSPAHTDCWFWDCENLSSVTMLNGITHLDVSTFSGCAELTSITIPNSVTSIGYWAFSGCHELKNITIPNSVTSIGEFAFTHCENLTTVTLSENLTGIAPSLFEQCKSLNSVMIPEGVTSIGNLAFNDCDSLADLTLPSSITYIGESVFYSCEALDYLYFTGTMAQWEAIEKHELWLGGSHIAHIYCSDGVISME